MTNWVYACNCSDIDEEDLIGWDYNGQTFAIYHIRSGFFCTDGLCTHEEQLLETGLVIGETIECPLHQGRFNIVSGKVISPPPCVDLNTYPTKVENGKVYVQV